MGQTKASELRKRGVKPQNPDERATCVAAAVRALERIGATFTVGDVAERAGLSRATIYRSPQLRALVGAKGDGVRTVEAEVHAKLRERHESTKAKTRDLRRRLADSERGWDEMRERSLAAERRLAEAQRHIKMLEAQREAVSHGTSPLTDVAARLGPEEIRQARRQLARALHPDLFARNTPAALLATELLKSINALAG